jgi:signal transduction histidine kinase
LLARLMSQPINDLISGTRRLAQGDFSHFFRIHRRDEIGRLLFSFNRMTSKLRQAQQVEKLSIVGRAATTIAHELKNSLVLIETFIQLLPQRHKDAQFIKELSETLPKELGCWNVMLQNMMEFSKTTPWTMTELNLFQVIEDVVSLAKLKAGQRGISLKVGDFEDLPNIKGNHEKLKQAFLNLIGNSIEATPRGGSIKVMAQLIKHSRLGEPAYIEIHFSNTGEGIREEHLDHIFEPFFTTKDGGLGLGLSISHEIVKRHQGEIKVVSERNKETSFIVRIPVMANQQRQNWGADLPSIKENE